MTKPYYSEMDTLKVLKISYFSGNTWGYAIWNAIADAEKRNKNYKLSKNFRHDILGNIMLAVSYRLDCLPIIIDRINEEANSIYKIVKDRDKTKNGYAFAIEPRLIHSLLVDIDSFIFELRSCCELMEKLIKTISRYFKKFNAKEFTEELPSTSWSQSKWYTELRNLRIDIFHHTAPYVDIDISNEPKYDLLFCKENIKDYSKSTNFSRLSEIANIYKNFNSGILALQKYIVIKINKLN